MTRNGPSVAAVIDEGALTFDLAIPCEVFGLDRSDIVEPWYSFELVSAGPPRITTQTGFVVEAPASLEALRRADTVVVPGWSDPDVVPGPPLVAALREAHERGARVVGLCTGAFVLAAAGLLDGRRATTHWLYAARLAEAYPQVRLDPKVLYVADDEVMTSAGTAAGIDLCLHVVSLDYGSEVAASVARRLVMPLHREGGQAQYIDQPLVTNGPDAMAELLSWARANLAARIGVDDLARHAAVSRRTLARRFGASLGVGPAEWLRAERLRFAQRLLETGADPVALVARRAGYDSTTTMRTHFAERLGISPTAYRSTFRAPRQAA